MKCIYTDAGKLGNHDKYIIACCDSLMLEHQYRIISCSDNNAAELEAVKLALELHPDALIHTDSLSAVNLLQDKRVLHIAREFNVCDKYIRMLKMHCR